MVAIPLLAAVSENGIPNASAIGSTGPRFKLPPLPASYCAFWRGWPVCAPFINIVIAGALQFTALALLQGQAPVFVALLTALVPRIGHASLGPRALMASLMVDRALAVAARSDGDRPGMTPAGPG